jgi:release factor glutamine methyltransferase
VIGLAPWLPREQARLALARHFASAGLPSSALDARLLVCAALRIDHAALIRDPHLPLGPAAPILEAMAARHLGGEPVSRIRGVREFYGLDFAISGDVLDPRPETETLVEAMLDAIGPRRAVPLRILDLGIGSGAILAALLTRLPQATGIGVDLSPAACRVADANLRRLGLRDRAHLVCGHWTAPLGGSFDLIVSNPPYIAEPDMKRLPPAVRFDPPLALRGGRDGLDAYRQIVPALPSLLADDGCVGVEIGAGQFDAVAELAAGAGLTVWGGSRDLAGRERVVTAGRRPIRGPWQISHKAGAEKDILPGDLAQPGKATRLQA